MRGCDGKPAPRKVAEDEREGKKIVYWHCPKLFIPNDIYNWYQVYNYYKSFQGAALPPFEKVSRRFLLAVQCYESALEEYREKIAKTKGA